MLASLISEPFRGSWSATFEGHQSAAAEVRARSDGASQVQLSPQGLAIRIRQRQPCCVEAAMSADVTVTGLSNGMLRSVRRPPKLTDAGCGSRRVDCNGGTAEGLDEATSTTGCPDAGVAPRPTTFSTQGVRLLPQRPLTSGDPDLHLRAAAGFGNPPAGTRRHAATDPSKA